MRDYHREGVQPQTADEALRETYRNEELAKLVSTFTGLKPPPTRKDDMLAALVRIVEGDQLQATWAKLTSRERAMVAQTAWSAEGFFDRQKFEATRRMLQDHKPDDEESKQEDDPNVIFGRRWTESRGRKPSLIELMMPTGVMSRQMQQRLRKFVPEPQPPEVVGVESPPESVQMPAYVWNTQTESYDSEVQAVAVVRREMEPTSLHDLITVLRLVDAGKVGITEKNRWPTPAAIRQVGAVLDGGDYYPHDEEKARGKESDEVLENRPGPIRAFAWPMLFQVGKLAQVRGAHLELTKAGRAALIAPPHEIVRSLWERWVGSDLLDELRRVNVIRGQTGKGKRYLTDPAQRRDAIAAALGECPVGRWVALDEFSNYMRAAGHEFVVSSDPWSLYIFESQYGSLGYEGYGGWNILQLRYLLCFLMEYAATLGLIDVAFIPPRNARPDYGGMWGTDDLSFFSRYDGLMFLRLTALGAYVLGLNESYAPAAAPTRQVLRVGPDLEIAATGPLTASDVLLLESFANKSGENSWRLDPERILDAEASGRDVGEFVAFLESASGTEVPESVHRFLAELAARANALRDLGPARLIGCAEQELAEFIAGHPATRKMCRLIGSDQLVVAARDEAALRRALRKLGFVLRTTVS